MQTRQAQEAGRPRWTRASGLHSGALRAAQREPETSTGPRLLQPEAWGGCGGQARCAGRGEGTAGEDDPLHFLSHPSRRG